MDEPPLVKAWRHGRLGYAPFYADEREYPGNGDVIYRSSLGRFVAELGINLPTPPRMRTAGRVILPSCGPDT
jgi:hypothetical protein